MSRYIVCEHEQGSELWLQDRVGKVTGSRAADMLSKTAKGVWSAKRADYMFELAVEKLTNQATEIPYVTKEMKWGTEQEPFARMAYEETTGNLVNESGFFYLPDMDAGCSVDGLFEDHMGVGVLESKSPKSTTHIRYLEAGVVPEEYKPQCLHNLWITGADFVDFVSFDPRFPEALQLMIVRWTPTSEEIEEHAKAVVEFIGERDQLIEKLYRLAQDR